VILKISTEIPDLEVVSQLMRSDRLGIDSKRGSGVAGSPAADFSTAPISFT